MYLRFTAPAAPGRRTVTRAKLAPGLFRAGYCLRSSDPDDPVGIAIGKELDWFNDHLPIPRRMAVKAKGVWWNDGVCWFRDSAREAVAHAYVLAALLEESGVRIDRQWSRNPGQILYRDQWQVVAKPEGAKLH